MTAEFTEEEEQKALNFLNKFASEHTTPDRKESLPFRVDVPHSVGSEEIHGYMIEWALEYLRRCNCPEDLAAIITHNVTEELLKTVLTCCKQPGNEGLDIENLVKTTFNQVENVCIDWSREPPKMLKSERSYQSYVHAIKNTRRRMEDKHVIMPYFSRLFGLPKEHPSLAFFAVYDGHGGIDAAIYASTHLHVFLANNDNLCSDPGLALYEAFQTTDNCFGLKAKAEGLKSGCTAVAALISSDTLYTAWLGDSQAVLSKAGEAFVLMEPHKPEQKDEKDRIEALGGCVVYFGAWRVNGNLSVSRAIGDVEHKPYVSGDPCVSEYTLEGDEEFLVIACDGLWDIVGREKVIKLVNAHISQGNDRSTTAKFLVDTAKREGSSDNISVIVIYFDTQSECQCANEDVNHAVVQDHLDSTYNGISQSSNMAMDNTANSNQKGDEISGTENVGRKVPINAKVKISTETTETFTTQNMTWKITCKEDKSYTNDKNSSEMGNKISNTCSSLEQKPKSADSSPKHLRIMRTDKTNADNKGSNQNITKVSNQLDIGWNLSSRRRSAPDAFTSF